MPSSNTFDWHFGQAPTDVCSEKSGGSPSSVPLSWPKSNSSLKFLISSSNESFRSAENGRPILLRKPDSGTIVLSLINCSTSGISNCRPQGIFEIENSHFVQANRR